MQVFEQKAHGLEDLPAIAEGLLNFAGPEKIICFKATMGAGKTTFIKALCLQLQSTSDFSSPTYSIVNEYSCSQGKIYHFDLYRLNSLEEAMDIGMEEYLDSGNYCFIEWPDLVIEALLTSFILVEISLSDNIRYFRATHTTK
jgi:tRNA threonylcarbamoyladenosine biosynthesis protein TsaE